MPIIFERGAQWVRADFHLHTRADREFKYTGDGNFYNSHYVDALENAGIRLGVITNHNKFDFDEFKALRKTAQKRSIALLPGVELSVNDGANGIHTIVVFSDEWIDEHNYINPFLTSAFEGKTPAQYEQENGRTSWSLLETIKKLESYHRDFFLVFAHVEAPSGLWANWMVADSLIWGRASSSGVGHWLFRRFARTTAQAKTNLVAPRSKAGCRAGTPQNWKAATPSASVKSAGEKPAA